MKITKLEYVLLSCCKFGMLDADEAETINVAVRARAAISEADTVKQGLGTFHRDKAIELTSDGDHIIYNRVGFDIACPPNKGERDEGNTSS